MQAIKAYTQIYNDFDGQKILEKIEKVARTCYKSEGKIQEGSAAKMVASLIKSGHEAMIEHVSVTVKFVVDRGISHELVRHRLASFAQESTRYCNYSKDKFGNELTFIEPYWWDSCIDDRLEFLQSCEMAEKMYLKMIKRGITPQFARDVLPLATKTELVMTGFVDDWKNFFSQRLADNAHPQARELATNLKELFKINKLL